MASEQKLIYKLEAENTKLLSKLDQSEKRLNRFSRSAKTNSKAIQKAFAVIGSGAIIAKITSATAKQEAAIKQLSQTLESTNNAVGLSFDELVKHAEDLQKVTTTGDEEIIEAQSKLATFTKITGDEFKRTTELALDMSAKFGTDVQSSVLQLGKALNDPVANLNALSRAGIQFDKDQKEMIKTLVNSGRRVEAQQEILKELEVQFGGSARAARDTFGGALTSLGNAAGDLLEADSLGGATEALNNFTELLQDKNTIEAAQTLANAVIKAFEETANAIITTINVTEYLAESFAASLSGPAADDIPRLQSKLEDLSSTLGKIKAGTFELPLKNQDQFVKKLEEEIENIETLLKLNEDLGKARLLNLNDFRPESTKNSDKKQGGTAVKEFADLAKIQEQIANNEFNKAISDSASLLAATITPLEQLNIDLERAKELTNEGFLSPAEFDKISGFIESQKNVQEEFVSGWEEAVEGTYSLFSDYLLDPLSNDFNDLVDSILKSFQRVAINSMLSSFQGMLGGFAANNQGSLLGGVAGLFAGARDAGGPIPGGKFALVGEKGPELVMGPANVVSRKDTAEMMGGNISMTFNISAPNEQAGRKAAGQVAREVQGSLASGGRYL